MRELLSGNEAIALSALHAGAGAAFGYPGTPSTEILESFVKIAKGAAYCEWSPNEKVALEAAAGASIAGARTFVTMKLVGLNVAADPMMTLSYIGVKGGMVIVVADDPGQHSSQTEQDTRHYARLAKIPVFEPGDAQEAYDYLRRAFEVSEKYSCPVIFRTTTCVSHSRRFVETADLLPKNSVNFVSDPPRWVPLPLWGRKMRVRIEERMVLQASEAANDTRCNRIVEGSDPAFGIVSHGVTALYCEEHFPSVPILKLGWSFPFPDDLIRRFASGVKRLIVIEEGDPVLEEHIRSLGIPCDGKNIVPRCGELVPARILEIRSKITGEPYSPPVPVPEAGDLPPRPPVLCPGCPHRALFHALGRFRDIVVTGDIGCYSLGVFPPLNCTDTILCMGAGFTMAHGMQKAGETKKTVGIVGDSTFFHSGITGLLDVVYNKGTSLLIVVDNRTTAMTGHQEHPGTGVTLQGETTKSASIEAVARACGMDRVYVCDPFDRNKLMEILKTEIANRESPALLISRSPCPLREKKRSGPVRRIEPDLCRKCKACLSCGCPAIEVTESGIPRINAASCMGCSLCTSLCKFGAIAAAGDAVK